VSEACAAWARERGGGAGCVRERACCACASLWCACVCVCVYVVVVECITQRERLVLVDDPVFPEQRRCSRTTFFVIKKSKGSSHMLVTPFKLGVPQTPKSNLFNRGVQILSPAPSPRAQSRSDASKGGKRRPISRGHKYAPARHERTPHPTPAQGRALGTQ
jgi:hypothetical protein